MSYARHPTEGNMALDRVPYAASANFSSVNEPVALKPSATPPPSVKSTDVPPSVVRYASAVNTPVSNSGLQLRIRD